MNGVQASNGSLPDWFQHATSGQLKLSWLQEFQALGVTTKQRIHSNRKRRQSGSKQCRSKEVPGISLMMNWQRGNIFPGANVTICFQAIC